MWRAILGIVMCVVIITGCAYDVAVNEGSGVQSEKVNTENLFDDNIVEIPKS